MQKRPTRTLADIEADLQHAMERLAEMPVAMSTPQKRAFQALVQIYTAERNDLLDQEAASQKRARLGPLYQEFRAQHQQAVAMADQKSVQRDRAVAHRDHIDLLYRQASLGVAIATKELNEARLAVTQVLHQHTDLNHAYNSLFSLIYKVGDPCPDCGKDFTLLKLSCKNKPKCHFHRATRFQSAEGFIELHRGTREKCPLLH